jgi:hypothetical protein
MRTGEHLSKRQDYVFFSPSLKSQVLQTRSKRIKAPLPGTIWLKCEFLQVKSGGTTWGQPTYAIRVTSAMMNLNDAIIDRRPGWAHPNTPETLLVIPRAPQGAQIGEVVLAIILTPPAFALDIVTFPISLPAAGWRPGAGP